MIAFILQRLAQAIPVMFLASVGVFLLLHLLPGDPAILMAGADAPTPTIEFVRRDMGLDQPLPVQYAVWLGHILRGDLGKSVFSKLPVSQLIGQRAPATLELATAGELLTVLIALPLGVTAAVRQRTAADWTISSATSLGLAIPNFWLGILMILLFAVALGWLPPGGHGDLLRDPLTELKFLILPAFTLALPQAMNLSRLTKASVLEMLYGEPRALPWAKSSPAFDAEKNKSYGFDLDKAKSLLAQSGLTNVEFNIAWALAGYAAEYEQLATILQADLAKIGVKTNLKPTDPPTFTQQGTGLNPPFNGMRLSAGAFTQLSEAGSEFALSRTYGYANNSSGFYDDKWTQLASGVATEADPAKRKQFYSDINDYLLDQSFTMAITAYPDIVATRPNVMDLKYFLSTATNDRNIWLS
jgi:peptide/nickel transport system permease protein